MTTHKEPKTRVMLTQNLWKQQQYRIEQFTQQAQQIQQKILINQAIICMLLICTVLIIMCYLLCDFVICMLDKLIQLLYTITLTFLRKDVMYFLFLLLEYRSCLFNVEWGYKTDF
ncbi:hypothetical protein NP493_1847g00016 [Ridgeia piscesae]|nr:hypothetical protein NP493_1847g00016 [Ridgeia piscesae]